MRKPIWITSLFCFLTTIPSFSQTDSLRRAVEQILKDKKATVGIAVQGIESTDSLSINGSMHFPMQSVFKFHIALAILNEVDNGKFSLNQKILVSKKDLQPNTWSPIREKYPNGNIELSLSEILKYTVGESDNNGCDILLNLLGGVKVVNDYLQGIGVSDVSVLFNEAEMHKNWNAQFQNWTTPLAAAKLLTTFYKKEILKPETHEFLWKTMLETSTGSNRIKGQLPKLTPVAHKTGSSGIKKGITAATNDIGIITLPDGNHYVLAVFISQSKENNEVNERIISDISKWVWDYFLKKEE